MLNEYKIKGPIKKLNIEIESEVAEILEKMEKNTKLSQSEITNTALKRFISAHKDFLPPVDQTNKTD